MRKPIITSCSRCSQLLVLAKPERHPLCDACNDHVKAKYDKFKNLPLIKALRIHKYLITN